MSASSSASVSVDGEGHRDGAGDLPMWGADPTTGSRTTPRPAMVSEPPVLVALASSPRAMGRAAA